MKKKEALSILGLTDSYSTDDARVAWKSLAKTAHPDAGGSDEQMREINEAYDVVLSLFEVSQKERHTARIVRDVSSFTVDVLPVDCYLGLVLAASHCGPVIVEEPPYMIEFSLHDTHLPHSLQAWCRCEMVPEAGSTTVHLSVGSEKLHEYPDNETVRDFLVTTLNQLNWI